LACPIELIEPFGFVFEPRKLRRTALDYQARAAVRRHASWTAFEAWRRGGRRRLVLLTTRAATPYTAVTFRPGDVLLCGRESAGAPPHVHAAADVALAIPLAPGVRSLNVVTALAMVAGEARRQLGAAPAPRSDT
jgi:tRNA (cytidine/uridine-2'-O-)-methyltransferase